MGRRPPPRHTAGSVEVARAGSCGGGMLLLRARTSGRDPTCLPPGGQGTSGQASTPITSRLWQKQHPGGNCPRGPTRERRVCAKLPAASVPDSQIRAVGSHWPPASHLLGYSQDPGSEHKPLIFGGEAELGEGSSHTTLTSLIPNIHLCAGARCSVLLMATAQHTLEANLPSPSISVVIITST